MERSLSGLIRQGFDSVCATVGAEDALRQAQERECALREICWPELVTSIHRRSVAATRQDELLAAAIRSYRRGPATLWGPVLLSMLAPALVRAAAGLRRMHGGSVDSEELDQQVVLEALRACAEMPLPDGCRFVQRRLVLLALKRLQRWAERENRYQATRIWLADSREVTSR